MSCIFSFTHNVFSNLYGTNFICDILYFLLVNTLSLDLSNVLSFGSDLQQHVNISIIDKKLKQ